MTASIRSRSPGFAAIVFWVLIARSAEASVVINEFRAGSTGSASDEFVELFNPGPADADISGWQLWDSSNTGVTTLLATVPPATILSAGCYYLFTNSNGYQGSTSGDQTYTLDIAADGGLAILAANGITIVDQIGMDEQSAYKEGSPLPSFPAVDTGSYRRTGGADSDDNLSDFEFAPNATPQNHLSTCEDVGVHPPLNVIARATTTSSIFVSWAVDPHAVSYKVLRSSSGTTFSEIATTTDTYYNDTSIDPSTAYLYRIRSVDAVAQESGDSASALATTVVFTDPVVTAFTRVKPAHITQLRTAINAVQRLANVPESTFPPLVSGNLIHASDVTDLRDALAPARTALNLPPISWTDSPLSSGITRIRVVHLRELREAVNGPKLTFCDPGTATCAGNDSLVCSNDGSAEALQSCDPLQGSACNPQTGRCSGPCAGEALLTLGPVPIGCDFAPTVTANVVDSAFHFGVAVVNTTANDATVTITRGPSIVDTVAVAANGSQVISLPWVSELKGPDDTTGTATFPASVLIVQGAYRLRSTQPVTVYQYNPLEYTLNNTLSYSNDASRLWPAHLWGKTFRIVSQTHWVNHSGFYAVTAHDDNTTVNVAGNSDATVRGGTGIGTDGSGTVALSAGDVLEIVTATGDLTGTAITADGPIQVLSGHQCGTVPFGTSFCDHMEDPVPVLTSLATTYVSAAPLIPGGGTKARVVRVITTEPSTNLFFDPPVSGAPSMLGDAGTFAEISTADSFRVIADKSIIVAEFMTGQTATAANVGDPSMLIATPPSQWQTSHSLFAPPDYADNFVNILAPSGTTVMLDGVALSPTDFEAIGTSYSVARKALSNSGSGRHTITASAPVGISVYGYGDSATYWH